MHLQHLCYAPSMKTNTLKPKVDEQANKQPNEDAVLIKAFNNSCKALGLTREQASSILGVDRATLVRNKNKGFDPQSKTGELCLQLVRVYRSLYAIAGGDKAFMQHWLNSNNRALAAKPMSLLSSITGLVRVNMYLDAMRGKT